MQGFPNAHNNSQPWNEAGTKTLFRSVYLWMTAGLAVTGLVSYLLQSNLELVFALFSSPIVFILLIVAQFGLVMFLSARLGKLRANAAIASFLAIAAITGVLLGGIFTAYDVGTVWKAFFATTAMFASAAGFGFFTSVDLSKFRGIMMMALIGIIVTSLLNIFLRSSGLEWLISFVGVILFTALTAFDTQKIKRMSAAMGGDVDQVNFTRASIMGALILYLDFYNLFLFILRLFGRRN